MKLFYSFLISLLFALCTNAQTQDLSLARAGDYVLGVHLFVLCDPIAPYDYVGKVKKFDIWNSDSKGVEKIIKKAKKKNAHFDGMIFKRDFDHVELIRFKETIENTAGFNIGDKVNFKKLGKGYTGTILIFKDHKQKAIIEYTDDEGNEQVVKVAVKNLAKAE